MGQQGRKTLQKREKAGRAGKTSNLKKTSKNQANPHG